jgi:hypothetical protein
MKDHLSKEQLNEWVLGKPASVTIPHMDSCAQCRHEAESLRQTLGLFRDSIHRTAAGYNLQWPTPERRERRVDSRFWVPRWAYAGTLAAILVVSVILLRVDSTRTSHQQIGSTVTTANEIELFVQIQADIGQDVPDALAPGELLVTEAQQAPSPAAVSSTGSTSGEKRR